MSDKKTVTVLQVEGMSCPGCEATVESTLIGLNGVGSAKADFSSNTVSIEYDDAVTAIPAMKEALAEAGYTVVSGAESKNVKRKFSVLHLMLGAVLLAAVCFGAAWATGAGFMPKTKVNASAAQSSGAGAVQGVTSVLKAGAYPEITVRKGIPVKWDLQADASILNSCNTTVTIPKFNIEKKLQPGDNIIEFTPEEAGTIPYSCKMGMIHSNITVVD